MALTPLDADAALNAAWARRAGLIFYVPRSARLGRWRRAGGVPAVRIRGAMAELE